MPALALGALLGLANALVIALGIAVREHGGLDAFIALTCASLIPALFAGMAIGSLAERTPTWPVVARLPLLVVPAFLIVAGLGALAQFDQYIAVACVPTLAAASLLERRTRARDEVPPARSLV
jgi:hypothetical protein